MATTNTTGRAVPPRMLSVGTLAKDLANGKVGVVMGHEGPDRVQLRPVSGGREWDAFQVRRLTAREALSARLAIQNQESSAGRVK
ncbi:hypothetical protein [Streptomyces chartreusis]|uniref:hypothetical protein n=1 Tax=Streptomyces chartreusis TaxID=1969 RepID=UPI00380CAB0A